MKDNISKESSKIRTMFNEISGSYDLLNRILSGFQDMRWRRRMVQETTGPNYLDLACGSGDVLKLLANRESSRKIMGYDISEEMLFQSREKLKNHSNRSIGLIQGDASEIPFTDECFDSITCAFGVRNFNVRREVSREVHRILDDGGRYVILEFFPPENGFLSGFLKSYMSNILPLIGRVVSGSEYAYEYLQKSIKSFLDVDDFVQELSQAGFSSIRRENLFLGLVYLVVAVRGESVAY